MAEPTTTPTSDADWLASRFEDHRRRLRAVAYRMLGSVADAEDTVQDAWLRLSRADVAGVENLGAWLTTVVARLALDRLRARSARPEEPRGVHLPDPIVERLEAPEPGPETEAELADSVGLAMLVVLETLSPPERLAFVLHDTFGLSFAEIGPIVDRSPLAARQLASRARRRIRGEARTGGEAGTRAAAGTRGEAGTRATAGAGGERGAGTRGEADAGAWRSGGTVSPVRQRELVEAFLAAARAGDFEALLRVLDPDVVARADVGAAVLPIGRSREIRGADEVARQAFAFRNLAPGARPAAVNGAPGYVVFAGDRPFAVIAFAFRDDAITELDILADPERLARLDLEPFRIAPPA